MYLVFENWAWFEFEVYWCHICLLNLYACRRTWSPIREAVKQSDLKNSHHASAPHPPKSWRERKNQKIGRKIHCLLISIQTKVNVIQDVDKIFDRVGICGEQGRQGRLSGILIFFNTDTTFTYIGSCLGVGRGEGGGLGWTLTFAIPCTGSNYTSCCDAALLSQLMTWLYISLLQ